MEQDGRSLRSRFIKEPLGRDSSNRYVETNGVGEGVVKGCVVIFGKLSSQHSWVR